MEHASADVHMSVAPQPAKISWECWFNYEPYKFRRLDRYWVDPKNAVYVRTPAELAARDSLSTSPAAKASRR